MSQLFRKKEEEDQPLCSKHQTLK